METHSGEHVKGKAAGSRRGVWGSPRGKRWTAEREMGHSDLQRLLAGGTQMMAHTIREARKGIHGGFG